jgi:NAD(P)-dependent dehydrogenase (short-subunit alcohol dehydrogenase family)
LGLYAASAILKAGARKVILISRKREGAHGLDAAIRQLVQIPNVQGTIDIIAADISRTDEIERIIAQIRKTEQAVDILIANAGLAWGGPFEPTPDASSTRLLDLNVRSVFNLIRLCVSLDVLKLLGVVTD